LIKTIILENKPEIDGDLKGDRRDLIQIQKEKWIAALK
jgi:hypothetical protein